MSKALKFSLLLLFVPYLCLAQSGREYRRYAVHNANLVKTVFGNWGVIGQPREKGPRGSWIYDNNGYIGDVSPMVGVEVTTTDTAGNPVTFHSVVVCPVDRPTTQREESPTGKFWGFEPVAGYFNEAQEKIAMSTNPNSWPPYWPDKMDDPDDPGWPGSWNGFFGKESRADQESYFVMDDNNDEEFNYAHNNKFGVAFKPDSTNPFRNGLGLVVKVRGMQWKQFLAQDCIFWLYEITNTSTTDYERVVFGALVGTYVGVTGTDDSPHEYDDDWSFFDVERDLTYTGDYPDDNSRNPNWVGPVGIVGYAFLESPGNPYDGIDNDGDADDYPNIPYTAPLFEESDFDSVLINPGDKIVLIDKDYSRTVVTVPPYDTTFITCGRPIHIIPGITKLVEGNVIVDKRGKRIVNPNAYDGIDNDLDGLIDENYYLHYHQIRLDQKGNVLIDRFNPVRHKDYIHGLGLNDPLIDERRDDGIDNDGDWNPEFDDVGTDGVPDTGDFGEGDGRPTPGEPNFDQTDVDESDQIGLTSFEYFTPASNIAMGDDEDLWKRLTPGYFEVPSSIQFNEPVQGEDGDFIYGSGYFPLRAGQTERFSLALVYGGGEGGRKKDMEDLLKNRETVQKIYNADYRFPQPPDKPTLRVVPGDGKVTLYWDRKAEKSIDPVLKVNDFEGYKIYRATDCNFNDVRRITNADGVVEGYIPIAQFDLKNGIKGYFRPGPELFQDARGYSFYLGDDTGLQHSYVDTDVENGRTYYYAVVAYDRGDETRDIFPSENTKFISILPTGEVITDINTAVAVPNAEVAGYQPPESSVRLNPIRCVGTGQLHYQVVDEEALTGHTYRVEFWDTSNDGVDNDGDWDPSTDDVGADGIPDTNDPGEGNGKPDPGEPNLDSRDAEEFMIPTTTCYSVRDLTDITESFVANDTNFVSLSHQHLIEETITVTDLFGEVIPPSKYVLDLDRGKIKGKNPGDLPADQTFNITYQYYPVYKSPFIQNSPYQSETRDSDIFDGITLVFNNHWQVTLIDSLSGWSDPGKAYRYSFAPLEAQFGGRIVRGLRHPADYEIRFFDEIVDTSGTLLGAMPIPVKFKVWNATDSTYIDFLFIDTDRNHTISPKDELAFVEAGADGEPTITWDMLFSSDRDTTYTFGRGDKLILRTTKPFRRGDVFEFTTEVPRVDPRAAQEQLDRIKVVPNPYVVATPHEPPLPPGITSGRGTRKIDFIHLPAKAKIHIFTSRGEHVITLHHDGDIYDGTVSWNLKSKENLDVAYGVYFYIVESPIGKKSGKFAVIK